MNLPAGEKSSGKRSSPLDIFALSARDWKLYIVLKRVGIRTSCLCFYMLAILICSAINGDYYCCLLFCSLSQ